MSRAALTKNTDFTTDPTLNMEQSRRLNAFLKAKKHSAYSYVSSSNNTGVTLLIDVWSILTILELSNRPSTHYGAAKTHPVTLMKEGEVGIFKPPIKAHAKAHFFLAVPPSSATTRAHEIDAQNRESAPSGSFADCRASPPRLLQRGLFLKEWPVRLITAGNSANEARAAPQHQTAPERPPRLVEGGGELLYML